MCLSNCNSVRLFSLQFLFFLIELLVRLYKLPIVTEESRLDSAGGATDKPADAPCALCALFAGGNPAIERKEGR